MIKSFNQVGTDNIQMPTYNSQPLNEFQVITLSQNTHV